MTSDIPLIPEFIAFTIVFSILSSFLLEESWFNKEEIKNAVKFAM